MSHENHQPLLQEAEIDIALNAGFMIATGQIIVGDSRELVSNITVWAKEFVLLDQSEWPKDEYIEAIDAFAIQKLRDAYGVPEAGK